MNNSFRTVNYFCKELNRRFYRVPRASFNSFIQQLENIMTFHLIKFQFNLSANKSEHVDNVISMDFAKTAILVLLSKSSIYSSR